MLNKEILISIFKKLQIEAKNSYDDFNSADGKIGDGDLGVTIMHGIEKIDLSSEMLLLMHGRNGKRNLLKLPLL